MIEDIPNKSSLNITKGNNKQMNENPEIKGWVTDVKTAG